MDLKHKVCHNCNTFKPITAYRSVSQGRLGVSNTCKDCCRMAYKNRIIPWTATDPYKITCQMCHFSKWSTRFSMALTSGSRDICNDCYADMADQSLIG